MPTDPTTCSFLATEVPMSSRYKTVEEAANADRDPKPETEKPPALGSKQSEGLARSISRYRHRRFVTKPKTLDGESRVASLVQAHAYFSQLHKCFSANILL